LEVVIAAGLSRIDLINGAAVYSRVEVAAGAGLAEPIVRIHKLVKTVIRSA
jgi:hypothetical protein